MGEKDSPPFKIEDRPSLVKFTDFTSVDSILMKE